MIHTFHSLIEYHETSAVLASIDWAKVASADAWLMFMGRLHPVVVHFPIALLLTAAGVETMLLIGRALRRQNPDTKMELPGQAVRICLALGVLSGLVACVSGWTLASVEPPPTSLSQTVSIHRWLAVSATIAGAIGLAISSLPGNRSHTLFRPFLLLSGVLVEPPRDRGLTTDSNNFTTRGILTNEHAHKTLDDPFEFPCRMIMLPN